MFMSSKPAQRGISLIELIVAMIIISTAVIGVTAVLNQTVWKSADPLIQKQAQVIAESLLEEIQATVFAVCNGHGDYRHVKVSSGCGSNTDTYGVKVVGRPYLSVKEYATAAETATSISAVDPSGLTAGPSGYSASVWIKDAIALGDISDTSGNVLLIRVTVSHTSGISATAEGFRTRYIPK